MASAADLFPRSKTPRHGVQGVVVSAPSGTDDPLTAEWEVDSFDGPETIAEKRIRWVSNGRMPATGDDALMVTDDRGDVWAFVWATGSSTYDQPTVRTAASAPINSVYIDSGDGKLYFKDAAGDSHATY